MKLEEHEINKDVDFNKFMRDPKEQLLGKVMLDKRISRRVVQLIPICSNCKHSYDINVDGTNLPGEIGKPVKVKCSNCGTEYEIAVFRSHVKDAPEHLIYNAFTIRRDEENDDDE